MSGFEPAKIQKWIFHVDMDAFFVSVEKAKNPALVGKPVVVGGNPEGRGVVAAASYEARRYGIHSAMPAARVKRLCPQALFIRGSYEDYQRVSNQIKVIFEDFTPDVEMVSIDEAFLDLTGFERLYGPVMETAHRIRDRILLETKCPASIGIATNKLVAKVASNYAKPNGILFVRPGYETSFFSHLSIDKIPGIGEVTTERLTSLGIRKVGDLIRVGRDVLELTMGNTGLSLYHKALGQGQEKLSAPHLPKSIGNETTFDEDTIDTEVIESILSYLTEKATNRLRQKALRARKVSLKLRYSDFQTLTRDYTFHVPTDVDQEISAVVISLFRKAFTRRTRVRLVGVTLGNLTPKPWQIPIPILHCLKAEKLRAVYEKVDDLRDRYGFGTLLNAHSFMYRLARNDQHLGRGKEQLFAH
ncbi:DNA polymerase IV [candidate division CSSED10-310 bacterium]|uniref:DNA polymerase IV n=1 Tax=candidate division CSSED10-310 bacterium TaxID=2855610 RepID=A0ABV6Z631_UNCC1